MSVVAVDLPAAGAAHLAATYVVWGARFILAFHYSSHRSLFKKDVGFLNYWAEWIMAPFFGIPSGVYTVHHCVMHHGEDNGDLDMSSTEGFQRDNILHFLSYWARYLFLGGIDLPMYCVRKGRWELLAKVVSGVVSILFFNPINSAGCCLRSVPLIESNGRCLIADSGRHLCTLM